jgi:hypothetical protein
MTVDLDELAERAVSTTRTRPPTMGWVRSRARHRRRRRGMWLTAATVPVLLTVSVGSWLALRDDSPETEIITVGSPPVGADASLVPTTIPEVDGSGTEPETASSPTIEVTTIPPPEPAGEPPALPTPRGWLTVASRDLGLAIDYPPGWYASYGSVTTPENEAFVISTVSIEAGTPSDCPGGPGYLLEALGPTDVLVYAHAPPVVTDEAVELPLDVLPLETPGVGISCPATNGHGLSTSAITVVAGGAHMLFAIVLGADVSAATRADVLVVVNSLRTTLPAAPVSSPASVLPGLSDVGPSQSVEDATRDGIVPEVAALSSVQRVVVAPNSFGPTVLDTPEGIWVVTRPSADGISGLDENSCLLGDPDGLYGRDYVCMSEYAEVLLLEQGTGRILRAYPFHSMPTHQLFLTDDAIYCALQGDGGLPDSMLCRIDRTTLQATVRVFPSALEYQPDRYSDWYIPPTWTIDAPTDLVLWQTIGLVDGTLRITGHSGTAIVDPVTLELVEVAESVVEG